MKILSLFVSEQSGPGKNVLMITEVEKRPPGLFFLKGSPMIFVTNWKFPPCLFFDKIRLEIVSDDHLVKKSSPPRVSKICILKSRHTAISRKVRENKHATIPKGNMGCDRYTVPGNCRCRTYFCCFPLALANTFSWPFVSILSNFSEEQWIQNHPQCLSGLPCALFPTTFLEIAVYKFVQRS